MGGGGGLLSDYASIIKSLLRETLRRDIESILLLFLHHKPDIA